MESHDEREVSNRRFATGNRRKGFIVGFIAVALALTAAGAAVLLDPSGEQQVEASPGRAAAGTGAPVTGETYRWAPVAIGGGGFISGLAMDPAGQTFVVRTDVYGAYLWDERGNRWTQLATTASMPAIDHVQNGVADGGYEVAVAPSRPTRIYMAIRGKVYRSEDRGANWTLASAGNPFPLVWNANSEHRFYGPFLAVDPADPDLLFLGTPGNGLWRSADAGRTWGRVASVPTSVDLSPAEGPQTAGTMIWYERPAGGNATGRIFAFASGGGMFVSSDRGRTFAPLPSSSAASPKMLRRGVFDRHGTFFGVDDIGKAIWSYKQGRWHDVTQESKLKASEYAAVAADPRSDRVLIVDQAGYGYVSADGGGSWSSVTHSAKVGKGDPPWLKVADDWYFATGDMMFDPVVPNRLWVAAGTGVFFADLPPGRTDLNWVSQTRGIEELVANDVIQAPGHPPVFSAWDFGMHIKPDLAAYSTWFAPKRGFIAVQQVDWSPADTAFLVSNASDTRSCCSEDGNAVMAGFSKDGGRTWTKFPTLPTPPGTKADDPWRMSHGSIAVSSGDTRNIIWQPAFNRAPFYTTDRGNSWHQIILPGAVGDNYGSFKDIWLQRKAVTADKSEPGVFYLLHSGDAPNQALVGIWRTRDGGGSWEHVFKQEIAPASNLAAKLRSVPSKGGHLFFTSAFIHAGDTDLRRSVDGGSSWKIVPKVAFVDDIAFGKAANGADYPAIYISGRVNGIFGVWRSVDDTKTWQQLVDFPVGSLDQVTAVGADPDVFGRVYLGYKGSGWIWGEPKLCEPKPYRFLAAQHCSLVQ